jgi:hypothetical protein
MARYDKYDPISGGFRAKLNADWPKDDEGIPFGVSLNANGRVVQGTAGQSGLVGVLVVDKTPGTIPHLKAGDVVDVMTAGEIVECEDLDPGTAYFAEADGDIAEAGDAIGHTVEAQRLVVRVTKGASA